MVKSVIYSMVHPITREIRYCGGTVQNVSVRLSNHIFTAKSGKYNHHCACWIKSLLNNGLKPEIIIIQKLDIRYFFLIEIVWIYWFRKMGVRLTNSTIGGEGALGNIPSEITRLKMSISSKGKIKSLEHRQNLSKSLTGKKASEETKLKQSLAKKDKKQSPQHIENARITRIGKKRGPMPEEVKKKLSLSKKDRQGTWPKGKKHSPESIEKMRLYHKNRKLMLEIVT